jgi:hypothetical protein
VAGFLPDELDDGQPAPPDDIELGEDDERDPNTPGNGVNLDDLGPLLSLSEEKAAKLALRLWDAQNRTMNRRKVRWKANYLRRQGVPGVRLIRTDYDRSEYTVWAPPGGSRTPPTMNKAARLCRRVEDNLFADPPYPDATPASDTDTDRAAAEFATRVLLDLGSESGFNNLQTIRESFSKASTYASGFRRYWVDPQGGGHRPKQIMASKNAVQLGDGDMDPLVDPTTGVEDPEPTLRYVARDGKTITDDAKKAALEWVPKIKCDVLTGHHVRMIPETVNRMHDASGAMVAMFVTFSTLKARYPDVIAKLTPTQIRQMGKYRPERFRDLIPDWLTDAPTGVKTERPDTETGGQNDEIADDAYVFFLCIYYRAGGQYPMGCYFCLGGDKIVLDRDKWIGETPSGEPEILDIPIDQVKQFHEGRDDPYGDCLMDLLGNPNEIRNAQHGSWIEHLDRFNNRKVFYPITSILQPKAMQQMTGTYIPINPGGQPFPEEIPDYPKESIELLDRVTDEMNDESGLQQAAQGLEVPDINSGVQANYTIEQANKALAELKQNAEDALVRGWRIVLQLTRNFLTQPMKIRWLGEDNGWKEQEWSGSDLGSTRDVRLAEGSFTMLTPSVKATVASQYAQAGVLSPDEYKDVIRTNISGLIDIEDDPFYLRVRRQITAWKDGPGKQLKQQESQWQVQQATIQQHQQAGAIFGSAPAPVPPPQPSPFAQASQSLFKRLPVDLEPLVAAVRHRELSRTLASTDFTKQPPEWQQAYLAEYDAMRQAAGVTTLQEQQQAQQSAAQQQMLLKEMPNIVAKATVDAQTVAQFELATAAGYQPPAPSGQPPQQQQPQNQQQQ